MRSNIGARLFRGLLRPSSTGRPRFRSRFAVDAAAWTVALIAAVWLRYEFDVPSTAWPTLLALVATTALAQLLLGYAIHLYRNRFPYGSFEEVRVLAATMGLTALLVSALLLTFSDLIQLPRSTALIAAPIALVLAFGTRYAWRLSQEFRTRPSSDAQPVLVYGAGYIGDELIRRLKTDPAAPFRPVGILDDDPSKRRTQLRTVRVLGTLSDLPDVASATRAEVLIVAIARADAEMLRRIDTLARRSGITVKVVPPLQQLLGGTSPASDIRDLSIEDLIGRQPVDTDIGSIAGYLTGRRVLVTGAGGSIGSELCRQISRFGPSELIMLDRDETGLQQAQLATAGHGLLNTSDVVLADIRDAVLLAEIFAARQPEVVFHAAALKHLPMLEQYPDEAWKTNVLGTLNVLEAARAVEVGTFINISTDKAANPTSVLGHSKRMAEKLTADASRRTGRRYLSVRFGNVIGSRGSMLPTFQSLIQSGGPLTVTHPEVTRYFMTIPEACELVVQAGGIGRPGEALILDMGEPVRILDIARRMIEMSGKDIDVVFTGLREGEKLHEELVGSRERLERPFHPKVSHTLVDPLDPRNLDKEEWERRMFGTPRDNDTAIIGSVPSARSGHG